MSSGSSPERKSFRDSTPPSPSSPVSPPSLPQWLRRTRPRSGLLSNGRLRVLLIASGCMMMGWMLTSTLGPSDGDLWEADMAHDTSSGGVSEDITGFGAQPPTPSMQPGILGGSLPEDETGLVVEDKKPSVTGALSELHDAVKDKLHAWNPYLVKPPHSAPSTYAASNGTSEVEASGNATNLLKGEFVKEGTTEEERLGARVRIGKCTILFNGNSFWERAIRTHERHDREHGYRLHVLRQHLMDDVWSKPAYILSLLLRELAKPDHERLEWLFWVDADTTILNPYIPIEVFLPPPGSQFDDIHLLYSNDWNGLNNGVFPVRVNQWSVQLFSAITSFRHYRPDTPLTFRDQSAMDILLREPAFANNIAQAPQRWFNAYQGEHNETLAPFQIRRGDFLVHFAGVPAREERMGYWLDRAEQHLDDWEIPVKSTSYPQEVRDFWAEQGSLRRQKVEHAANSRLKAKELLAKIDQSLADYGDRLGDEQRASIQSHREALNKAIENEQSAADTTQMAEAAQGLETVAEPLTSTIASANKLLLQSAHEVIFAAERDLLESGFNEGARNAELERVSETVKYLKTMVMTPQEHWIRHDITAATNAVTEARARLHETMAQASSSSREAANALATGSVESQASESHAPGGQGQVVADPPESISTDPPMHWSLSSAAPEPTE
ncbi:glycosyltransferase family 34 [Lecanosticta acicola]|uniref:Glycosyltransferase family 34 n=1 Tax=Lecanosticta acicola TaxID=111012 RepID=A0AAI8YYT4_9PEZI|nr:glycosyltransferase family 34 [Lecanosticta acicola]